MGDTLFSKNAQVPPVFHSFSQFFSSKMAGGIDFYSLVRGSEMDEARKQVTEETVKRVEQV